MEHCRIKLSRAGPSYRPSAHQTKSSHSQPKRPTIHLSNRPPKQQNAKNLINCFLQSNTSCFQRKCKQKQLKRANNS
jgi:hypothetical protein